MAVTGNAIFFALAAIVQLVIGFVFVARPERRWGLALGILFLMNGLLSLANMHMSTDPFARWETAELRLLTLVDPLTSFVILFLALQFPQPVSWLAGNKRNVAAFVTVLASVQFLLGWGFVGELTQQYPKFQLSLGGGMYFATIQELAWVAVLLRWSHWVGREKDWRFTILASMLALRASHMAIVVLGTRINFFVSQVGSWSQLNPGFGWALFSAVLPVAALGYAFAITYGPGKGHGLHQAVFGGFLLAGFMEATFSMVSLTGITWPKAPFLYMDVYLVRPLLAWGCMYGMPATKAGRMFGGVVFAVLALTAFIPTGISALAGMQLSRGVVVTISILYAIGMLALLWRVLMPMLSPNYWQELPKKAELPVRWNQKQV